jgi:acyl-CoA thioesterase-1
MGFLHGAAVVLMLALAPIAGAAPAAPGAAHRTVLVVGDSLSAEYGLARGSGWVQLLSQRIATAAPEYSVVNASISGDTTSGGRARLAPLLRQSPAVVVIELGANDGLRGLSVDAMHANLQAMVQDCRRSGAKVLLVGIHVPPNYGPAYADRFYAVFTGLAQSEHVALAPFLLDGFADQLEWFQPDHIHPLAKAQGRMLDNVWPYLRPLLRP